MEIISFDVKGKTAHFRKFYSSSTALSYSIPPKTTIQGIIGAILGLERDSYYDILDSWQIGISINSLQRKIFQKQNFLNIKSQIFDLESTYNDVSGEDNRTQVSFEQIIPQNIRNGELCFRVYIAVIEQTDTFLKLKCNLEKGYSVYGLSLGTANCLGYMTNFVQYERNEAIPSLIEVDIKTACYDEDIHLLTIPTDVLVENEQMPVKMKMVENKNELKRAAISKGIIFPVNGTIRVKVINENNFRKLINVSKEEIIAFL